MRILGIETSGLRGSVALVEDGLVVAFAEHSELNRHAEETLGLIDRVLGEAGWHKSQLERVGASVGPGSFTGVRVGLSLATGLSMGLGIPTVGIGSLRVAAAASLVRDGRLTLSGAPEWLVVLRDARREEFFLAAYDGNCSELIEPEAIAQAGAEEAVAARLAGQSYRIVRTDPDAKAVALLAAGLDPAAHPLTPHYVRDSGATPQNIPVSPLAGPRVG